jgi:hypothetical protein
MPKTNEATSTNPKVIERLRKLGWKRGDTLLYQQEYALSPDHQKMFDGKKSIKPDITLTDINGNIVVL